MRAPWRRMPKKKTTQGKAFGKYVARNDNKLNKIFSFRFPFALCYFFSSFCIVFCLSTVGLIFLMATHSYKYVLSSPAQYPISLFLLLLVKPFSFSSPIQKAATFTITSPISHPCLTALSLRNYKYKTMRREKRGEGGWNDKNGLNLNNSSFSQ